MLQNQMVNVADLSSKTNSDVISATATTATATTAATAIAAADSPNVSKPLTGPLTGMTFIVTGSNLSMPRNEFAILISSHGGQFAMPQWPLKWSINQNTRRATHWVRATDDDIDNNKVWMEGVKIVDEQWVVDMITGGKNYAINNNIDRKCNHYDKDDDDSAATDDKTEILFYEKIVINRGHRHKVEYLVEMKDRNEIEKQVRSAKELECYNCKITWNLTTDGEDGRSNFLFAITSRGVDVDFIEFLISVGADIHEPNGAVSWYGCWGNSALMEFVKEGKTDQSILCLMLSKGSNMHYKIPNCVARFHTDLFDHRDLDRQQAENNISVFGFIKNRILKILCGWEISEPVSQLLTLNGLVFSSDDLDMDLFDLKRLDILNNIDLDHEDDEEEYKTYSELITIRELNSFLFILEKWPITMAIIMLQELAVYYHLDASSIIDIFQYTGIPETDYKSDNKCPGTSCRVCRGVDYYS